MMMGGFGCDGGVDLLGMMGCLLDRVGGLPRFARNDNGGLPRFARNDDGVLLVMMGLLSLRGVKRRGNLRIMPFHFVIKGYTFSIVVS